MTARVSFEEDAAHEERVGLSRPIRVAVVATALLAVVVAAVGRLTGSGHVTIPGARPVAARALRFVDRADGGIDVRSSPGDSAVLVIAPGQGGFVRGAMRGLARGRIARGVGDESPFILTRWSDGRLTLDDSATASHVELNAFGGTNAGAFAAMLPVRAPR